LIKKLAGSELPVDTLAVHPFELQHLTESDQVRVDRMLDLGMSDQAFYIVSTARERWLAEQTQTRPVEATDQTRVVPQPVDVERERRQLAFAVADLVSRGEVHVSRFDHEPFNLDCSWADANPISWREWARPAAESRGYGEAWDRCTLDADSIRKHSGPLGKFWAFACAELDRPASNVLDLRGMPSRGGPGQLPVESWLAELSKLIQRDTRGIVLLVESNPWEVERLVPYGAGTPWLWAQRKLELEKPK
jgi:hypothetical protein